jgi:hypothetical protein
MEDVEMENRTELLRRLRKDIEGQYLEALEALAVLERIPCREDGALGTGFKVASSSRSVSPPEAEGDENGKSHRDNVLGALTNRGQTVAQLSTQTGLEKAAVRGVLYAPALRNRFKKRKVGKEVFFKRLPDKE